jgi:hypothetical protein
MCFLLLSQHSSGKIEKMHENTRVGWPVVRIQCQGTTAVNMVSKIYECEATSRSCNEVFILYLA